MYIFMYLFEGLFIDLEEIKKFIGILLIFIFFSTSKNLTKIGKLDLIR